MGVIFVAGVHGVGKTTCCKACAEISGIPHFSASEIIKAEKTSALDASGKTVKDVQGNQELLISGVRRRLSQTPRLLLDGHFTLLDKDGQIEAVGVDVFRHLDIKTVVLYRDTPEAIASRLQERDGKAWETSSITAHQGAEIEQAHRVAAELGISFAVLDAFDSNGLIAVIGGQ